MTDHLFVYGTLMRAAARSRLGGGQRARLDAAAQWLGPALMAGRLYDQGRYPLLTATADAQDVVHGEVYRLRAPADVFGWLDPYEGIPVGATAGKEYARLVRPATLGDGAALDAWVYLSTIAAPALPRIAGGRWTPM